MINNETIIALATPNGMGAISVIRISGSKAISVTEKLFKPKRIKLLSKQKSHTVHLGNLMKNNFVLDEVLVTIFKCPNSYTGEDTIEISCHGSTYIQQKIIDLYIENGIRVAKPGEFTLRAFLNGKMNLNQAEAVADLIASENEGAHNLAIQQMKSGFSNNLKKLRSELLHFSSMIELELDFSQEDVEFAERDEFQRLINKIIDELGDLINSFSSGNVIKNGIAVAIAGKPNAGKSSLLNTLLNEEKAIVSNIPGTTRDSIEDSLIIEGIKFKFTDTAGLRKTSDIIESKGIEKTKNILLIFDDILSKQKFLKSNILTKLITECRHYNISCIINSQYYKKVPAVVRTNCRGLILFPSSLSELEKFTDENCLPNMSKKRFLELIQHCTDKPYQFAFINHDAPNEEKLRKNFNIIIN